MTDLQRLWSIKVDETCDREALGALDEHLKQLGHAWAGSLRFKVAAKCAALRQASKPIGDAFAARYGLPAPDGRWLHQYRLGDASFVDLPRDLKEIRTLDALAVLFCPSCS